MTFTFSASGSLEISGSATAEKGYRYIEVNQDFTWEILPPGTVTEPIVWWWRVTGQCVEPTAYSSGFELNDDACGDENGPGVKYIQNLTALDLPDLCKRMKETFLTYPLTKWRVRTIERFTRPLRSDTDADLGKKYQCLIPQDFCEIPECMDFCLLAGVDDDSYVKGKANAVLTQAYVGSGELKLSGEAHVVSSAYTWNGSGNLVVSGCCGPKISVEEYVVVADANAFICFESIDDSSRDNNVINWESSTSSVNTACACLLPPRLYTLHNFNKLSKLAEFLSFNDSTMPLDGILVYYGSKWSKSYHLVGDSVSNEKENWILRIDWSCNNTERGQLGGFFWSFLLSARRTIGSQSLVFKLAFDLESNIEICLNKKFDVSFSYNPLTKLFTTNRGVVSGYVQDQMGMFVNQRDVITVKLSNNPVSPNYSKMSLEPYLEQPPKTIFGRL